MVRHVIIWKLRDELSDTEKQEKTQEIKRGLEGLKGVIEGLAEITVHIDLLDSSNGDLMLDSVFADRDALGAYQKDPRHLAVASVVRSAAAQRSCADFEI